MIAIIRFRFRILQSFVLRLAPPTSTSANPVCSTCDAYFVQGL